MQSLLFDFLEVTEQAAVKALPWIGTGKKNEADKASTNTMRQYLNSMTMNATVVIGEGEIDEAPMLYIGEKLGEGGPSIDIAVDPIDGTTPAAKGQDNAITVIAAAPKGTLLHAPDMYMEKLAVGPKASGKVDINQPIEKNIAALSKATGKRTSDLTIMIQDRPRHQEYISRVHATGAKVNVFNDGDIVYALATCIDKYKPDMLIGIGGAPEGVISAAAVRCLGGDFQAKLFPKNDAEYARCKQMGIQNVEDSLSIDDLVATDDCIFVATGITDNPLMQGITKENGDWMTHSIVLNGERLRFVNSVYPV